VFFKSSTIPTLGEFSQSLFYFEDQVIIVVHVKSNQNVLVVVIGVVCCVMHSFQSHQLLHRHFLPVNKLCRQTALPCV